MRRHNMSESIGWKRAAICAIVVMAGGVLVPLPGTLAHVAVEETVSHDASGHAVLSPLCTTTVGPGCGATYGATTKCNNKPKASYTETDKVLGTSSARGSVAITIPTLCRGGTFTFNPNLFFTALPSMAADLVVTKSSWTGGVTGSVALCVSNTHGFCVSGTVTMTQASPTPVGSTSGALASGKQYGLQMITTLNTAGTVTLTVLLGMDVDNTVSGLPALAEYDAVNVTITQN